MNARITSITVVLLTAALVGGCAGNRGNAGYGYAPGYGAGGGGYSQSGGIFRSGRNNGPPGYTTDGVDVIDHQLQQPGDALQVLKIQTETPVFEEYLIATGDVLDIVYSLERQLQQNYPITLYHTVQVNFVNAPELSQEQAVLPDGSIQLPYLGAYYVVGKTTNQLRRELREEYGDILVEPEIFVRILNFNARVQEIRDDLETAARGLSKLVTVRPDGYVTFPYIGDRYVEGRTIDEVLQEITPEYQEFIDGLNVSLFMHEQTGTQIYTVGELQDPGAITVNRPINVVQAVSRAGGYTQQAETSNVFVFRRAGDRVEAHRFNITDMGAYGSQALNFYLQPEDVLLMPRSKISSLAQLMTEVGQITFFNGWSFGIGQDSDLLGNQNSRRDDEVQQQIIDNQNLNTNP